MTPLGNESRTIDAFIDEVLQYLDATDRWYCIFDRVSNDGTRDIVERKSRSDERVAPVWASESRCVVEAYFAGYTTAYTAGCNWILEMDAGFSHPPQRIPEFVAAIDAG